MHAFSALWRVADGSPTRLHVACDGDEHAVVEPGHLESIVAARRALPPPFDGLPLRLPVSPAGLAAFAGATRGQATPGPDPAPTHLGLVPWAPSWDDHVSPRQWRRLLDHGYRITLLGFGTGYSSIARMTLPLDAVEIDGLYFGGDEGVLAALAPLARSRGLSLVAGAGAVDTTDARQRLHDLGFDEYVGQGLDDPAHDPHAATGPRAADAAPR